MFSFLRETFYPFEPPSRSRKERNKEHEKSGVKARIVVLVVDVEISDVKG